MTESNNIFPFDRIDIDPILSDELKNYFDNDTFNTVSTRFGPKGYLFPKVFEAVGSELYNMDLRPSDIFMVTFPKSVSWTPYFEHVKEAWQLRHHPNMLFLFYKELSRDLAEAARRVAKYYNKQISEVEMQKLCEHLKIDNKSINCENMKELGFFNKKESFIRQGKVGGWKSYFDEEMAEKTERWIEENLRDTDLRFPQ